MHFHWFHKNKNDKEKELIDKKNIQEIIYYSSTKNTFFNKYANIEQSRGLLVYGCCFAKLNYLLSFGKDISHQNT